MAATLHNIINMIYISNKARADQGEYVGGSGGVEDVCLITLRSQVSILSELDHAGPAVAMSLSCDGEERTLDDEPRCPLPGGDSPDTVREGLLHGPGQTARPHRARLGLHQAGQTLTPVQLRHCDGESGHFYVTTN